MQQLFDVFCILELRCNDVSGTYSYELSGRKDFTFLFVSMEIVSIIEVIDMLLIVGVSHGLFITFFIFHKHRKLYPNRFLGLLMLVFSLAILHIYLGEKPLYNQLLIGELLPSIIFLIGPLHFLYAKYLVVRTGEMKPYEYLHLLPTLVILVYGIFHFEYPEILPDIFSERKKTGFLVFNWLYILTATVYYLLTVKYLRVYSIKIKDILSNIEKVRLNWLQKLTFIAIIVNVVFLAENILSLIGMNVTEFFLSSLLTAIYVYAMVYTGMSKSDVLSGVSLNEMDASTKVSNTLNSGSKYQKSGLKREQADLHKKRLLQLMEKEKVYRKSNLTLGELAEELSISVHHLSEIINMEFEKNFYDFVNAYRIEAVIQNLKNKNKEHLTLLAIGLESGFNSKSAFNTIFKKFTGQTPSQYRNSLIKQV
ncbi:MAG: helix-turn-helix domain-containing protein [Bacteroidota bacterium]